jgi:DNA-binding MarR family transcriptional regulator
MSLSEEQQRVWRNYLSMTTRLQAAMSRQLQTDCGLSLADYDVLVALDEQPRCRISDLGERLGWEQSRVSHQLSRMRARGLIERRGDAVDRRAATVDITAGGQAALASAAPGHAELVRTLVFDGLGPSDLHAVNRWTAAVLDRVTSPTRRT